jgi:hypothetical protein
MTATYATEAQLLQFLGFTSSTDPFQTGQVQAALDRAQVQIESETDTKWVDGSTATPAYGAILDEKHDGKGLYDRSYFLEKFPIPALGAVVTGTAVVAADTTIYVDSTNGFPSSGVLGLESDKIVYTGKSGSAFTGCSGVLSAHGTAKYARPYVIEASSTEPGSEPVFVPLIEDLEFDIDKDTGRVEILKVDWTGDAYSTYNIPRLVPNRFRASYLYGYSTIPSDMTKLCLLIASRDLMKSAVRKAHALGQNSFNPELINVDDVEIDNLLQHFKHFKSANV